MSAVISILPKENVGAIIEHLQLVMDQLIYAIIKQTTAVSQRFTLERSLEKQVTTILRCLIRATAMTTTPDDDCFSILPEGTNEWQMY